MSKNFIFIMLLLITCIFVNASEYKIKLSWDEFEGELNGVLSGTIGHDFGVVNGIGKETALSGNLKSMGESVIEGGQSFIIKGEKGFFTFWIKDKMANEDNDLSPEMDLIYKSKPVVKIYKDESLLKKIEINQGEGISCKVFTFNAYTGEIEKELKFYPLSKMIFGRVVNAVNGKPMKGVDISVKTPMAQFDQKTDQNGYFMQQVEIGKYEVIIHRDGFITTSYDIMMGIDETPREFICALAPKRKEFRIVLTWGNKPRDLDAHLSGPNPDGGNFHIWYRNKILIAGKDFLDHDALDGYGPETITIYKPAKGEYFYSIHDFTNRVIKNSRWLSRSGAVVKVYAENRLLKTFSVPEGIGNCWHVFRINENHQIEPINEIDFVKRAADIR